MKTNVKIILGLTIALLHVWTATAEVYWLTPRGGGGRRLDELAEARELMTEPVTFNGVKTELKVSSIRRRLTELLAELKQNYPDLQFRVGADGVLLRLPVIGNDRERVLLVGGEASDTVTVFTMLLPEKMPPLPEWPKELPLPTGAKPEEIIFFHRSQVWYGAFSEAGDPELALAAAREQLAREGFLAVTAESSQLARGRGEIFMREKPRAMLWLNFDDRGNGVMALTPL